MRSISRSKHDSAPHTTDSPQVRDPIKPSPSRAWALQILNICSQRLPGGKNKRSHCAWISRERWLRAWAQAPDGLVVSGSGATGSCRSSLRSHTFSTCRAPCLWAGAVCVSKWCGDQRSQCAEGTLPSKRSTSATAFRNVVIVVLTLLCEFLQECCW